MGTRVKGMIPSVLSALTAAEFPFPLCLMEVYHCVKKGNPKQRAVFCSKWTLFIQTKCLKGRQSKDTTWQDLPPKAYLELYRWRSRGGAWRLKKGKRHTHLQKKGQKVNLKNHRLIGFTLMVPGERIKHGFTKGKLCLTHLIASCDQDLRFWTKSEHCMSFILTSARLSTQSYTIFLYPSSDVTVWMNGQPFI